MKTSLSILTLLLTATLLSTLSARADEDRYDYCRDKARGISGYNGSVPAEYEDRGGAVKGAIKGASVAAGLAWLAGGNSKDRKKAAKRGAGIGLLIGAIKKGEADKKRRENARKRRDYEIEINACMAAK